MSRQLMPVGLSTRLESKVLRHSLHLTLTTSFVFYSKQTNTLLLIINPELISHVSSPVSATLVRKQTSDTCGAAVQSPSAAPRTVLQIIFFGFRNKRPFCLGLK